MPHCFPPLEEESPQGQREMYQYFHHLSKFHLTLPVALEGN